LSVLCGVWRACAKKRRTLIWGSPSLTLTFSPLSQHSLSTHNTRTKHAQHLMKRIQRGPVRGISLKLQEEERERRLDFVPEVSAVNTESIPVDADTAEMLKAVGLATLPGIKVQAADRGEGGVPGFAGRERRPRAAAGAN